MDSSAAICALTFQLAREALAAGGFVSAFSIYAALVLALNAAGVPSSTHEELARLLAGRSSAAGACPAAFPGVQAAPDLEKGINSAFSGLSANLTKSNSAGAELLIANSVWTRTLPLRPEYVQAMKDLMQATARQAQSVDVINAWASEATRGLIKVIVPPGTPFDAVLANALYFKGKWEHAFDKAATLRRPFTLANGASTVQVPMMQKTFGGDETSAPGARPAMTRTVAGQYQAIRLPYQGGAFSAIALLPAATSSAASAGNFAGLPLGSGFDLGALLGKAGWQPVRGELQVLLPRFKAGSRMSLTKALQGMGVREAFTSRANFKRLTQDPVAISDVLHAAVVEVDEEGTVAAAVTAVTVARTSATLPQELVFDRPFLFMVVHDATATPLFMGAVTDPSQAPQL